MTLTPDVRLGVYQILAPLGAGGMGEVYRARDTKLGRDVAIKVLPSSFASDPDRLARFEREARLLASLNHPNIGAIYGVEETGGVVALVLELVEGETLTDRIAKGSGMRAQSSGLPIADALAIARQIADALDAAHERGIVHRDLKPANIVITPDGVVKVLDFGLAKGAGTAGEASGSEALTHSPTVIGPTLDGVLLGTAPYMSPEQARGKIVDKRTDIWAFGCVLYEMLTGRRAFSGETTSDTIAAILERQPDWTALPAATPRPARQVLQRCLEKDPKRRLRDIGDANFAEPAGDSVVSTTRHARRLERVAWVAALVAGALAITVIVLAAMVTGRHDRAAPDWAQRAAIFAVEAPSTTNTTVAQGPPGIAVSHDARFIAWAAENAPGRVALWVYNVETGEQKALPGTDGATTPFWSPDGRALGFLAQASLKIIDLASGNVRAIAAVPDASTGGTWNSDNVIVYSARYALYQIPASGGQSKPVAALNRAFQENSLRYPRFLPDGRHFLYVARSGRSNQSGAYVGSLDGTSTRLFATTSYVYYAAPGYLLYAKDGALVARAFDPRTLAVASTEATVVDQVGANAGAMSGHFDVSDNGVLAYFRHSTVVKTVLRWFDRSGRALEALNEPAAYSNFRVAPDDRRVVVDLASDRVVGRDVWVLNPGAAPVRMTFGGTDDWWPFWSPDGQRVAFMSYRNGVSDFYVKTVNGAVAEEPLVTSDAQKAAGDWSRDGRFVVYWVDTAETRGDILVSAVDRSQAPMAIARTAANERRPRFSPDGRYVSYDSDESGRSEVYVQPFPPTGGKWQVSIGGGTEASWNGSGHELYYVDGNGALSAVTVTMTGGAFSAGRAERLFEVGRRGGTGGSSRYEPASDGRRFLVRQALDPAPQPLRVMLNWPAGLRR